MTKFETLLELRLERQKLYLKKEMLEDEIKLDFEEFRESLRPVNMIKDLLYRKEENSTKQSVSPAVLSLGSTALDLILGKVVFGKSSIIKKLLSSYVIKAVGPSLITKATPLISRIFKEIYDNFSRKNHKKQHFEQSTSSELY